MPTIRTRTGDPGWDQTISSLGDLLTAGDKAPQAYYYGSQARHSQLESNKLIDQGNWRSRYGMMTQGGPQPAAPTWQQPDLPGAPPILAPASNIPMAGAPVAAAPGLGATVAASMTPQQAADMVPAAVAPLTTGTPSPGTPPTGSNGTPVANDPVSGVLHPASITDPGGGQKQSGPAAANGSPAPMPPGMTLPGLMSMSAAGSLAGLDAATVAHGGATLAYELYSRGMIGRDQYHQMLGATGSPTLATADTAAAASVTGANIAAGAHVKGAQIAAGASTANQAMQTGESKRQFDETPVQTIVDGKPVYTTRAKAVAAGLPFYDPQLASTQQQGANTLANTVASAQNTVSDYVNPAFPTVVLKRTLAQAQAEGLRAVTGGDQQSSVVLSAAQNAATPADAAAITERRDAVAPPPAKPTTAHEINDRQTLLNQQLAALMPAQTTGGFLGMGSSTLSPAASPDFGPVLNDLTNQYMRTGPTKGDPVASAQAALSQLVEEKRINLKQDRSKQVNRTVLNKDGTETQVPHFEVDLLDPDTGKPVPAGARPRIIAKPLSTVVVPGGAPTTGAPAATAVPPATTAAAPAAVPPGTPIGTARPGTPDGPATVGGKPVDVRGGVIYSR